MQLIVYARPLAIGSVHLRDVLLRVLHLPQSVQPLGLCPIRLILAPRTAPSYSFSQWKTSPWSSSGLLRRSWSGLHPGSRTGTRLIPAATHAARDTFHPGNSHRAGFISVPLVHIRAVSSCSSPSCRILRAILSIACDRHSHLSMSSLRPHALCGRYEVIRHGYHLRYLLLTPRV